MVMNNQKNKQKSAEQEFIKAVKNQSPKHNTVPEVFIRVDCSPYYTIGQTQQITTLYGISD